MMGVAAALAPLGMLIALHPSIGLTLAIGALVACAHLVFQVNTTALAVDRYPLRIVATVFGLIAACSALGGLASTRLVGQIASTGSYDLVFLLMALLHPVGWLLAWGTTRGGK